MVRCSLAIVSEPMHYGMFWIDLAWAIPCRIWIIGAFIAPSRLFLRRRDFLDIRFLVLSRRRMVMGVWKWMTQELSLPLHMSVG